MPKHRDKNASCSQVSKLTCITYNNYNKYHYIVIIIIILVYYNYNHLVCWRFLQCSRNHFSLLQPREVTAESFRWPNKLVPYVFYERIGKFVELRSFVQLSNNLAVFLALQICNYSSHRFIVTLQVSATVKTNTTQYLLTSGHSNNLA